MNGQDFKDFFMIRTRKKRDLKLGTGECTHSSWRRYLSFVTYHMRYDKFYFNRLPHI